MDCLTLLHEIYGGLGIGLPREFCGVSMDSYIERWEQGELRTEYADYFRSIGRHVEPHEMATGDLLTLQGPELDFYSIYLGNGNFITCLEDHGVQVMPLRSFAIKEVRRCGG